MKRFRTKNLSKKRFGRCQKNLLSTARGQKTATALKHKTNMLKSVDENIHEPACGTLFQFF